MRRYPAMFVSAIVTASLCFSGMGVNIQAASDAASASEEVIDEVLELSDEITDEGFIITTGDEDLIEKTDAEDEIPLEDSSEESVSINSISSNMIASDEALTGASLPSRYIPSKLTAIQTQVGDLCWAYSALDAAQIGLLANGVTSSTNLLYSPGHMAYSAYNYGTRNNYYAEVNGTKVDSYWHYMVGDGTSYTNGSGNYQVATATLLDWYGAASASKYATNSSLKVSNSQRTDALTHLEGYEHLGYNFAHNDSGSGDPSSTVWANAITEIKESVKEYGAVAIDYDVTGYNGSESIVYHDTLTTQNHQGVIVGWDDTKETGAAKKGAFYIKNTYGTGYGEKGYRWLSYYDMSMTNPVVYHFEQHANGTHDYNTLYSYSRTDYRRSFVSSVSRIAANVFTADAATQLSAIGTYLPANGTYTLSIETGLKNGVPGTGTVVSTVTGSRDNEGFYTIPLTKTVSVKKGESFAVRASVKSNNTNRYYAYVEGSSSGSQLKRMTVANKGQSFYEIDGTWYDTVADRTTLASKTGVLSTVDFNNFSLKAYGNPVKTTTTPAPTATPTPTQAAEKTVKLYRLYNPNSGEHFYTASLGEKNSLVKAGWKYEGIGWTAPATSSAPVYRLYNPNAGDHHYTMSTAERQMLVKAGWKYEGIGWYSDTKKRKAVYREYNPNAVTGTHNYTTSYGEHKYLISIGWKDEKIGWYAVS